MLNNGIASEIPNLFKLDFTLWRRNKIEKAKITKVKIAVIAMKNSLLKKFEAASASSLLYPKKDGKKNATMKTIDINPMDPGISQSKF